MNVSTNQADRELTAEHTQVFSDVAKRMKLFAAVLVASPLLSIALTFYQLMRFGVGSSTFLVSIVFPGVGVVFYSVIAVYTILAAASLQSVAENKGRDMLNIIHALNTLKRLFGIQYWLIVIALLVVVLWMIAALTWVAWSS